MSSWSQSFYGIYLVRSLGDCDNLWQISVFDVMEWAIPPSVVGYAHNSGQAFVLSPNDIPRTGRECFGLASLSQSGADQYHSSHDKVKARIAAVVKNEYLKTCRVDSNHFEVNFEVGRLDNYASHSSSFSSMQVSSDFISYSSAMSQRELGAPIPTYLTNRIVPGSR